jgi:TPP-dependent pyruvate/acetoin dehydrogenase alpha subunit
MDRDRLLGLYRQMRLIRRFDETCMELKKQDLIMNGFHPYSGEEAVAVGVCAAIGPDDFVVSTHRPSGHSIAKGSPARSIFCELLGRQGGPSDGIGGPMQWIDAERNFVCGSIVGSGITVATGVALAMQREGRGRICVCFFGDGASNTGSFHEGLNLAAIWRLPVVYVCENNQYGEAMPVERFVSGLPIAKRAQAYGLEGVTVDGMDVEAVLAAAETGVAQCRAGLGPAFIEAVTYRFFGHYGGDPEHTYRTREEVDEWRKRCPLKRCRERLTAAGLPPSDLAALEAEIEAQVAAGRDWALAQPFATVEEATEHVMVGRMASHPHPPAPLS